MGQYLLDTHTLLWLHDDSPRLSERAKSIIIDNTNDIHISIASFWEITIKKIARQINIRVYACRTLSCVYYE